MKNLIEQNFKIGDCVQLASGGYKMTITRLLTKTNRQNMAVPAFTGYVECTWFEESQLNPISICKDNFPQEALRICQTVS